MLPWWQPGGVDVLTTSTDAQPLRSGQQSVLPETLLAVTVLPIAGKSFSPDNVCQSIILRQIQSQSTTNRCNTCSPVQETVQVTSTIARTSSGNCNSRSAFASAPACVYPGLREAARSVSRGRDWLREGRRLYARTRRVCSIRAGKLLHLLRFA
ncbi:hypothetical protein GQ55_9G484400 [Panicum hallii var. hallii]|uniref:Uncharacterized protein n=1 Tax=Panicum hallii var. hallii TaxID=1504633 RepID=A0A2T7CD00_9POAL|nr:hypothetical protein GQ55_9G484400 [Panicum hallii var. hallii]